MNSLRGRLIAGILVAISVFLAVDGVIVYAVVRARLESERDASLAVLASSTAAAAQRELAGVRERPFSPARHYVLDGVSFGPWVGDQDPRTGEIISRQQFWDRLQIIRGDARRVRTYGVDGGLEDAGWLLHLLGKEAVLGAWIGRNRAANAAQVETLIRLAGAGDVDLAVFGSEVLHREDLPAQELVALLREARAALPAGVPLTTADTWEKYLAHPELRDVVDVIYVNYHPFWNEVAIEDAMPTVAAWHDRVLEYAAGKPVIVSETGWPSAGDTKGLAVPSEANASRFFLDFVSWARANDVEYTYFSALDEAWKADQEGPHGAHWGYRHGDGTLKPRMQQVFDGVTVDLGPPGIDFELVTSDGDGELHGRVTGVGTLVHRVAVFLRVDGAWYTKPSFAEPVVRIASDGSWTADVTTGPGDERADQYAAFLVPAGYEPPPVNAMSDLPGVLRRQELPWKVLAR